jgi:hypothetical protein
MHVFNHKDVRMNPDSVMRDRVHLYCMDMEIEFHCLEIVQVTHHSFQFQVMVQDYTGYHMLNFTSLEDSNLFMKWAEYYNSPARYFTN